MTDSPQSGPAVTRRDAAGWVLAATGFLAAPLAAASGLATSPLLAVAGVALLGVVGIGAWHGALPRLGWALLACGVLWAALSLSWTVAPLSQAARTWAETAGTMIAGAALVAALRRLDETGIERVTLGLSWGLVVGSVIVLAASVLGRFGHFVTSDPARIAAFSLAMVKRDRGAVVIALLLWPTLAGLLRQGRTQSAWLVGILSLVTVLVASDLTAKVALVASAFFALLMARWPRPALPLGGIVAGALLLASPLLASHIANPEHMLSTAPLSLRSAAHRMVIWKFVATNIAERPVLGHGLESSRVIGDKRLVTVQVAEGPLTVELLPLHPHNAGLQIWLELGAVGALLASLVIAGLVITLRRAIAPPFALAAAAGTLVTGFLIAEAGFGIWQSWWLASLWLGAGFSAAMLRPPAVELRRKRQN